VSLFFSSHISNHLLSLAVSFTVGAVLYCLLNKALGLYAYQEAKDILLSRLRKQ